MLSDLSETLRQHTLDAGGVQVSFLQLGLQVDDPELRQFADFGALGNLQLC